MKLKIYCKTSPRLRDGGKFNENYVFRQTKILQPGVSGKIQRRNPSFQGRRNIYCIS